MTRDSHVRVYAWLARVLLPSWLQGDGQRKRGTGNRASVSFRAQRGIAVVPIERPQFPVPSSLYSRFRAGE
jgi:hypothetical protein